MDVAERQLQRIRASDPIDFDRLVRAHPNGCPKPDPDSTEPLYAQSVARYHAREQEEARAAWIHHHNHMACLHRRLSEEHEEKARLLKGEGLKVSNPGCSPLGI